MKKLDSKIVYDIEKGISIPERYQYPFDKMEIGDSFKVEIKDEEISTQVVHKIHAGIDCFRTRQPDLKYKFVIRTIDETCVRCWRIK